jgi:hypothetical protein
MTEKLRPVVREIWPPVVLAAATLGFFWRILFTPDAWKPAGGGDLVSFLFPTYRFAAASLRAGHLPLWNPYLYGGVPFLADMQTGLFYPLNQLLFLMAPGFSYKAMEWMVVVHVFLAGLFMYLCLRYLEPGRPMHVMAALTGASAYMFSDLFVVHFGNLNLVAVAAWLPLVFLLFWRALRGRSLPLAAGAGLALGISTLEGHLQITLYIGLAMAVAALVEAAAQRRLWRERVWPFLALAVATAVSLGLAALVLLPAWEYTRLSPRAALSYQDAARYSLVPGLLGEMLVPALFSSQEPSLYWGVWDRVAAGYLGIFPLMLAGIAVFLRRGRAIRLFVILAGVALLLALGGESVIHGWAYRWLPGFGQIRAPARMILLVDFALAGLAALGIDRLLAPLDRRERKLFAAAWRGLVWLVGASALIGGAWAYLMIYQAQDRDPTLFWRVSQAGSGVVLALLIAGAGLAWLGARRSGRVGRRALGWLAAGLVFVDLASVGAYTDLGNKPPTSGYDHPLVLKFLRSDPGFFRIDSRTDVWGAWQPDMALLSGLYDVAGVDNPLAVADMARFWDGIGGRSTRLYDLLGVRYVLGSKEVTLDRNKFSLVFDGDLSVNVYRNETALPRAFLVHRAVIATSHEDAWNRIHEPGFDPVTTVVLEGGGQALDLEPAGQAAVRVVGYEPEKVVLELDNPAGGYLLLSDPFYPGWQARVDGEPAAILQADYAFRAVAVPAGTHQVTMVFQSSSWYTGRAISLLTLAILLVLAGVALLRRHRALIDHEGNKAQGGTE